MLVGYPKPRGRTSAGTSGTKTVMDDGSRLRQRKHPFNIWILERAKQPKFAYIQRTSHAPADIGKARGSIWHERGHSASYNRPHVSSKGPQPSTITTNAPLLLHFTASCCTGVDKLPHAFITRPFLGFVHHHELQYCRQTAPILAVRPYPLYLYRFNTL